MGRTGRRAAATAIVVGFTALLGLGAHGARAQADAATRALEYLQGQQSPADGSLPGGFSVDDLYAIGAAAAGYDPNTLRHGGPSVVEYLTAEAAGACPLPAATSPSAGGCGELIQAALAAGKDPHAFGGIDLVARLVTYYDATTGAYGDGEAFTQALAIQGLVAAAQPVPAAAVTFLHAAQDSDGGWDFMDVHDDPNAATNFDTSDSNSTAMVLMALDATGDHSRDVTALTWLHTLQNSDGGFSFQGGGSDPDSTALVLQAIVGSGGNPASAAWTVDGNTPAAELIATQDASGGYTFPGNAGPDAFTTSQVPPALDGVAFPVSDPAARYTPGTALGGQPPAPSPSPTPEPTANAGPVTPVPATPAPTAAAAPATQAAAATAARQPAVAGGGDTGVVAAPSTPPPATPVATASPSPVSAPPPAAAPSPRVLAASPPAPGGPPSALIYVMAAVAAAALVAGSGYLISRR